MSTQRGNTARTRAQKNQNKQVYNNLRYDSNHRSIQIKNTDVVQVCDPCQKVLEWKIKFKKYKPLTQAKTCTKCAQKAIKNSYHTVCIQCSQELAICGKCGKQKELVKEAPVDESMQLKEKAALEAEIKLLPVGKRKTFYRYLDQINNIGPKKDMRELEDDEDIMRYEEQLRKERQSELSHKDLMKAAYEKIEELKKHCKLRHTFEDDFDDLDLDDTEDEDDDE